MRPFLISITAIAALLLTPLAGSAEEGKSTQNNHEHHGEHKHNAAASTEATPVPPATAENPLAGIGIDEHLGSNLPLDARFTTSEGREVALGDLVTKPTLIQPVFFNCAGSCSLILHSVATIAGKMELTAGKDFQLLAISFDDEEVPELAKNKRTNFLKLAGDSFPPEAWQFIYGSKENIDLVMNALGFRYKKLGTNDYAHPNAIIAVSPTGLISRYLYGATYQPFDASMALEEARKGQTGITVRKLLSYCFTYDKSGSKYILNVSRLAMLLTLAVGLAFAAFLVFGKKRSPRHNA
jgi:protein SCO1/2